MLQRCTQQGPEGHSQSTAYKVFLRDGVMVNAAPLWPLLRPLWREPEQWWEALCRSTDHRGLEWSQQARQYWPERVRRCAEEDPSIAVVHNWLWELHPAIAWRWELRLQLELGQPVALPEEQSRAHFLQQHSSLARILWSPSQASASPRRPRCWICAMLSFRLGAAALTAMSKKLGSTIPHFSSWSERVSGQGKEQTCGALILWDMPAGCWTAEALASSPTPCSETSSREAACATAPVDSSAVQSRSMQCTCHTATWTILTPRPWHPFRQLPIFAFG